MKQHKKTIYEQRKRDRNRLMTIKKQFEKADEALKPVKKILSQLKEEKHLES